MKHKKKRKNINPMLYKQFKWHRFIKNLFKMSVALLQQSVHRYSGCMVRHVRGATQPSV